MKLIHPDSKQEIEVLESTAARYIQQGWRQPAEDAPKGNSSLEDWQEYARSKGFAEPDLEGLTRDAIRAALA